MRPGDRRGQIQSTKYKTGEANKSWHASWEPSHTWPCEGEVCGITNVSYTRSLPWNSRFSISLLLSTIRPFLWLCSRYTNALLDDGSSATIIKQAIADKVEVNEQVYALYTSIGPVNNKENCNYGARTLNIPELVCDTRFNLSEDCIPSRT